MKIATRLKIELEIVFTGCAMTLPGRGRSQKQPELSRYCSKEFNLLVFPGQPKFPRKKKQTQPIMVMTKVRLRCGHLFVTKDLSPAGATSWCNYFKEILPLQ